MTHVKIEHMWILLYILLYKFHWQPRAIECEHIKSFITIDRQFNFSVKLIYYFISIVVSISNFKNSNVWRWESVWTRNSTPSSQRKYWMEFSVARSLIRFVKYACWCHVFYRLFCVCFVFIFTFAFCSSNVSNDSISNFYWMNFSLRLFSFLFLGFAIYTV